MDESDIETLREQVRFLQGQVETLTHELDRAVQLIDRYGETLGRHLRTVIADHGDLAGRIDYLERALPQS
ncbi:MAG: hypothetical protein AB7P20_00255 [Rhizobiaceae bacterium]